MKRLNILLLALMLLVTGSLTACEFNSNKNKNANNDEDDYENIGEYNPEEHKNHYTDYFGDDPQLILGDDTYFRDLGIELSDLGPFEMSVNYGSYGKTTEVPANIMIKETYKGCNAGEKKVIFTSKINIGGVTNYGLWTSYFDKYTGTSFEISEYGNSLYNGCYFNRKGTVPLSINGNDFDVDVTWEVSMEDDIVTDVVTFICPREYDGIIMQAGNQNSVLDNYYDEFVIGGHTADFYTVMDSGDYKYFTWTSNQR